MRDTSPEHAAARSRAHALGIGPGASLADISTALAGPGRHLIVHELDGHTGHGIHIVTDTCDILLVAPSGGQPPWHELAHLACAHIPTTGPVSAADLQGRATGGLVVAYTASDETEAEAMHAVLAALHTPQPPSEPR